MNTKFSVKIKAEAVARLFPNLLPRHYIDQQFCGTPVSVEAEGTTELWEILERMEVTPNDVQLITVEGESANERIIGNGIRALEPHVNAIYLDASETHHVYLIAAVQHGGLVEYQVSDGIIGERSTSLSTYEYAEAQRIFSDVIMNGWPINYSDKKS